VAPDAPAWYRSNRGNLISLKYWLGVCLDGSGHSRYLDAARLTADPAQMLNNTGCLNWSNAVHSRATALAAARMPTNWFDYTPYRGLTGLGGFTNDPTATPHGWTNEYTVAGGTNFPSGRSTWYTTDYGWSRMTNLLGVLTVTTPHEVYYSIPYPGWIDVVLQEPASYGFGQDLNLSYTSAPATWATAKSLADASYPTNWGGYGPQHPACTWGQADNQYAGLYYDGYRASAHCQDWKYKLHHPTTTRLIGADTPTNMFPEIEVFEYSRQPYIGLTPTNQTIEYSAYGTVLAETNYVLVLSFVPGSYTNTTSPAIEPDNPTTSWCLAPSMPSNGLAETAKGFRLGYDYVVSSENWRPSLGIWRWARSGGFRYY
jgi:hypothetical protein